MVMGKGGLKKLHRYTTKKWKKMEMNGKEGLNGRAGGKRKE